MNWVQATQPLFKIITNYNELTIKIYFNNTIKPSNKQALSKF